jgi:hypothetical protein
MLTKLLWATTTSLPVRRGAAAAGGEFRIAAPQGDGEWLGAVSQVRRARPAGAAG